MYDSGTISSLLSSTSSGGPCEIYFSENPYLAKEFGDSGLRIG